MRIKPEKIKAQMWRASEECLRCLQICLACLRQCQSCGTDDAAHKECMAACEACITACAICWQDCSYYSNATAAQCVASCTECAKVCSECAAKCEACAKTCAACKLTCEACEECCEECCESSEENAGIDLDAPKVTGKGKARITNKAKTPAWFTISNKATRDGATEIHIYGEIGADGFTAADFINQVKAAKPKSLDVRLNSPGGSVFDGLAIYNWIRSSGIPSHGYIDGVAASIGSVIAMAVDELTIAGNGFVMIHNPAGSLDEAEADDARRLGALLDKVRNSLISAYMAKTEQSRETVEKWMDEKTWFDAEEALKAGLVDQIGDQVSLTACAKFDFTGFGRVPTALGGKPATTETQKKEASMKLIIAALVAAGITVPADATEEQIVAKFNELKNDRDSLKAQSQKSADAAKKRVEARVKAAIEAKKVKPEREASLVAMGIADESNLDFLDDIAAPQPTNENKPRTPRGAAPAPALPSEEKTGEDDLSEVRQQMFAEKDPVKLAALAKKAREIRGHKNLFADVQVTPVIRN